eukprot:EG_transcript_719
MSETIEVEPLNLRLSITALEPPKVSPRSALQSPGPVHRGSTARSRVPADPSEATPSLSLTRQSIELIKDAEPALEEYSGLELLRRVFDSMATEGRIMMDQLPFVLAGAEVSASAEQVQQAIEEFIPDADDAEARLEFDQVQTLYHQLAQVSADELVDTLLLAAKEERPPSAPQRLWRWLVHRGLAWRRRAAAFEIRIKPTTRLLLLILLVACLISTSVVVFAVVFIFDHTNTAVIDHLVRDANLLTDGLNMFGYTRPFAKANDNLQRMSTILGVVIDQLGYQNSQAFQVANLAYQRDLVGDLLNGWYASNTRSTVDSAVTIVALWLEGMLAANVTLGDVVSALNAINPRLPTGHEVLLAQARNGTPELLTAPRFAGSCAGGCSANRSTALRLALQGANGTSLEGVDYRPRPVTAAYRLLLNPTGVALAYSVSQSPLRSAFQPRVRATVDAINGKLAVERDSTDPDIRVNSQEFVLAMNTSAGARNLTTLRFCNATCVATSDMANSFLALALVAPAEGPFPGLAGEAQFVAVRPLTAAGLGLVVKIAQGEFLDGVYGSLGKSLNEVNTKLPGTQELQLVTVPKPWSNVSTNGMKYWTKFRFANDCNSTCGTVPGTSLYLQQALADCSSGMAHSLDYRSQMVTAAAFCVPSMGAALAVSIADSQIIATGVDMAVRIANYQTTVRNAQKTTEVIVVQRKPGVTVVRTRNDYTRLSIRKFASQCPNLVCDGPAQSVFRAANGETGYMEILDYRWVPCMSSFTYLPSLNLGVAVKIDTTEAQADSFRLTGILCGASVSAVLASMLVLALLANMLLQSMDRAWEEGKRAIEREKLAFRAVIEAMYPAEVAQRMLMGETQIVYDIPAATVFFSDIYEFTTTSNNVTPEELIRFMGYTFGVMDSIGDYYSVYKVKTIGDAYLGVTGLPGMQSLNGSSTIDLMLFASACAQVFSNRFLHPDEGTLLADVAVRVLKKKNILKGPEPVKAAAYPRRPSVIGYGHPKDAAGVAPAADDGSGPLVHCIMRYGLALGPLTAGVLQGKTPLFDIWGKTVNLASRMESTGQAGRIQVSEGVFKAVMMFKNQPFTFDGRHKVYCKGFGHVSAYFVGTCAVAPPKNLLVSLNIEPNWGCYHFQNPVPAFGVAKAKDPTRSSTSGSISPRSQQSHNSHPRG